MKNLIIITSVINTSSDRLSYAKRSIYSKKDRYNQTLNTIKSCKNIKDYEILFIETSKINNEEESNIINLVDYYFNFNSDDEIQKIIDGPIKGKAESTQIWNGIKKININKYDNIFKISGRYWLNENFIYSNYENNLNIFKEGPNNSALATVMYKISKPNFKKYIECLNFCRNDNGILEQNFIKFFKDNYITFEKIGIEGNVSVDGNKISW